MSSWLMDARDDALRWSPDLASAIDLLLTKKRVESRRIRRWFMNQIGKEIDNDKPPRLYGIDALIFGSNRLPGRTEYALLQLANIFTYDCQLTQWDLTPQKARLKHADSVQKATHAIIRAIESRDGPGYPSLAELLGINLDEIISEDEIISQLDHPDALSFLLRRLADAAEDAVQRTRPRERFSKRETSTPEMRVFACRVHDHLLRDFGLHADSIVAECVNLKFFPEPPIKPFDESHIRSWTGRKKR